MPPLGKYTALFLSFFTFLSVQGVLVNVTIDDTYPDPITGATIIYQPTGAWSSGKDCRNCSSRPDITLLTNSTWHESISNNNTGPNNALFASTQFTGSAVYLFCVLGHTTSLPDGESDMTFLIDGEIVGTFAGKAPGTQGYTYNVAVYSNTSLSPGHHQFTVQNGHINGTKSLMILDSIVYTYDDGKPASSPNGPSLVPIVGGIVGGLLVVLAIIGLFFWRRRRSKKQRTSPAKIKTRPVVPNHDRSTYAPSSGRNSPFLPGPDSPRSFHTFPQTSSGAPSLYSSTQEPATPSADGFSSRLLALERSESFSGFQYGLNQPPSTLSSMHHESFSTFDFGSTSSRPSTPDTARDRPLPTPPVGPTMLTYNSTSGQIIVPVPPSPSFSQQGFSGDAPPAYEDNNFVPVGRKGSTVPWGRF